MARRGRQPLAYDAFVSVAKLSSELRGVPLDTLIGEDLRQHRRTKQVVRGTIGVLAALVLAASGFAWFAVSQQRIAEANGQLAVQSAEEARRSADLAMQAAESEQRQRVIAEEQTRLAVAQRIAAQGQLLVETGDPAEVASGSLLVLESMHRDATTLQGQLAWSSVIDRYPPLAFGPQGEILGVGDSAGTVHVLDTSSARNPRRLRSSPPPLAT